MSPTCLLSLVLLLVTSVAAVVVVDMRAPPPLVLIPSSSIPAGDLLLSYGPQQGVRQVAESGSCLAASTPSPIVNVVASSSAGNATLSFPPGARGGDSFFVAGFPPQGCGPHTRLALFDVAVSVDDALAPHFPVSVLVRTGQFFFAHAPHAETLVPLPTGGPPTLEWTAGVGLAGFRGTQAMEGHSFVFRTTRLGTFAPSVRLAVVVPGPLDVIVPLNALSSLADITIPFGGRIIWTLPDASAGADEQPSYPRLSDSNGRVSPLDGHAYSLAYTSVAELFPDAQFPMADRWRVWATPPHRSGVWYYRDMLRPQLLVAYRVTVTTPSGAFPTPGPISTPPAFQDYFQTSALGIRCNCNFGPAANLTCGASTL